MRVIVLVFFMLLSLSVLGIQKSEKVSVEKCNHVQVAGFQRGTLPADTGVNTASFFVNFVIGAVGAYSIYGFVAGLVSAGITYFVVNGDKKATLWGVLGAISGIIVGISIKLLLMGF